MSSSEPVSLLLEKLRAGDHQAAQALWQKYFPQLVALARTRLRATSRRVADEEDVALSAFDSFCQAAERGCLPDLKGADNLWGLLVTITARKAADLAQRNRAQKRGGGRVRGDSAVAAPGGEESAAGFDALAGHDPTPDMAAQLAEEFGRLLQRLDDPADPHLHDIALWKMQGHSNAEIAAKLGCSIPTVERRLRLVRTIFKDA
jgi:DNA-directed RNA polymerase specialized sigma24 family protein